MLGQYFAVSRQIRAEAIAAYFRWNHFTNKAGANLTMLFGQRERYHGDHNSSTMRGIKQTQPWEQGKDGPQGLLKEVIAGVQNRLNEVTLGYECDWHMDTVLLLLPLAKTLRKVHIIVIKDLQVDDRLSDLIE